MIAAAPLVALVLLAPPRAHAVDLFAAIDRGTIYRSTNSGATWAVQGSVAEPEIAGIQPGLTPGTLFLLGSTGDVYASIDAGLTWSVVGNAGASDCVDLAIARNGDLLALTQSGDLLRSQTGGATWTTLSNARFSDGVALSVGGKNGAIDSLYAITSSGDVAASATGSTWSLVGNTGFPQTVDLVWTDGLLRALTDAGELLRSTNRGTTWSAVGTASQVGMRALTMIGTTVLAIAKEGEIAQSADGSSWSWVGTVNQVFVVAMALGTPEFQTGVGAPGAPPLSLRVQAYPNPFAVALRLRIHVDAGSEAFASSGERLEIAVYDAAGRLIARPYAGAIDAFPGEIAWRPEGAAAGVYFLRIESGARAIAQTSRVVLIK